MSVKVSNHIRVFVPSLELAEILKPTIHSEITERKQMSTKTMKQRIAVVAVSALTAGVLSVASAPVANAYGAISYGATTAIPVAGQMNIGLIASTSGTVTPGTGATLGIPNSMTSVGFVSKTSTTGTLLGSPATALQLGDTTNGATFTAPISLL